MSDGQQGRTRRGMSIRPAPGTCCPEMDVTDGVCEVCGHDHGGNEQPSIDVSEKTKERYERKKAEMDAADPHVPELTDDQFMKSLLDTLEAVQNGHYTEHGVAQEDPSE